VEVPPPEVAAAAAIDADRTACLMTPGNVWASKTYSSPAGIENAFGMVEDPVIGNNTCYSQVSMTSADIKDFSRFFGPRYFEKGGNLSCGSWLDEGAVDQAILDAKKGSRIGGTIAATFGGLAVGVGVTELIGNTAGKNSWYLGQKGLKNAGKKKDFLLSKLNEKNDPDKDNICQYVKATKGFQDACSKYTTNNSHCKEEVNNTVDVTDLIKRCNELYPPTT
jgi:hypothetical protein